MTMRTQQFRFSTKRRTARRALCAAAAVAAVCLPQGLAAGGVVKIPFNAANFSDPLDIDNEFYPLVVGTTTIFKATGTSGCEEFRIMVTSATKQIAGVTTRVIHDEAFEDPECDGLSLQLVEKTDDWFAQDNAGNVWYFGEATEDCDANGCATGPGSWQAGVNGAVAGIVMLAHPTSGDQYYQEFAQGVAEDQAKVTGITVHVSLTRDDARQPSEIDGCLKTKEYTALNTGFVEQKYYCPGVGLIAVDEHHGKNLRFELTGGDALRFRTVR